MDELTLLDFDSVPDIYINLLCAENLNSDEKLIIETDEHSELVITISDNTLCETKSGEINMTSESYPAYTLFPLKTNCKYKFMSQNNQLELIHLKFDMYTLCDSKELPSEAIKTYKPMLFKTDIFTASDHIENWPNLYDDINRLKAELKGNNVSKDILRRQIESLILTFMTINFSAIESVMHALSAVALTNTFPLTDSYFKLAVSNIRLWSDNPENNHEAELLQTNYAQHKYVEKPRKADEYRFDYTEKCDKISDSCCELSVVNNDSFKLWLFPNANPLYLSKYKSKATVTLKLKCSTATCINLYLYSIPNYCCFSYSLTINQPNVWQSFSIPIIGNSASKAFHPLAVKAINYIKDNYASKLMINDIADELHIHPSYLSAVFKKSTGKSVNSYINFYRINIAKQMLIDTDSDIASIAAMTGFYDSQHFLKTFKKVCGTTPTAFRKNGRAKQPPHYE